MARKVIRNEYDKKSIVFSQEKSNLFFKFMLRKLSIFIFLGALAIFSGCSSFPVPNYIPDHFPYKKQYYASFKKVSSAIEEMLPQLGWQIAERSDPGIFEYSTEEVPSSRQQILIFTEIKKSWKIFFSTYRKVNIYIRSNNEGTEVELRYMSFTPLPFNDLSSYKNSSFVRRFWRQLDELLNE